MRSHLETSVSNCHAIQGMLVQCYIAIAQADDNIFASGDSATASELSAQLPANDENGPERVVGTLDLNQGDASGLVLLMPLHF